MDTAQAAALLDEIARTECNLNRVWSEFRRRAGDEDSPAAIATLWALAYGLLESSSGGQRDPYGGPYRPLAEFADGVYPPYVDTLHEHGEVLTVWQKLSSLVGSPAAAARISDLLWVTRHGSEPYEHARAAAVRYIAAAKSAECDGLSVAQSLDRAMELSREINAPELAGDAIEWATDYLRAELRHEEAGRRPGIFMRLLRLLVRLDAGDRPSDLDELIGAAHGLLEENPTVREGLYQLEEEVAHGEPERVAGVQRARAEMLLRHALQQEGGLARQHWLSRALDVANNKPGASGMRDVILRHIQEIDPDSYDFVSIPTEMEIPTEQIEAIVEAIVGVDGVAPALDRLATALGSPTGDPVEIEQAVDEAAQQFVFTRLVGRVVLDDEGRPILYLDTDEDKRRADVVDREKLNILFDTGVTQAALDRIRDRYSASTDEIRNFFLCGYINAEEADAFARALEHYWSGRFDESLHVALPRIEAVLRRILAEAGRVVYREPRGSSPGGVRTLGRILKDLRPYFGDDHEGWWRSLRTTLTDPLGLNLRNRHLHGLAGPATKHEAAAVLKIAAFLRLVRPSADSEDASAPSA